MLELITFKEEAENFGLILDKIWRSESHEYSGR